MLVKSLALAQQLPMLTLPPAATHACANGLGVGVAVGARVAVGVALTGSSSSDPQADRKRQQASNSDSSVRVMGGRIERVRCG